MVVVASPFFISGHPCRKASCFSHARLGVRLFLGCVAVSSGTVATISSQTAEVAEGVVGFGGVDITSEHSANSHHERGTWTIRRSGQAATAVAPRPHFRREARYPQRGLDAEDRETAAPRGSLPSLLQQQQWAVAASDTVLGINPGMLALLLNFEEDQAPLHDSSGTGYLVESTVGRYDLSNTECKRGGGCFETIPGGPPDSAPVKIPCLKLNKDWSFTVWLKNTETRPQSLLFYGYEYPRDFFLSCQVIYGGTPVITCENSTGDDIPGVPEQQGVQEPNQQATLLQDSSRTYQAEPDEQIEGEEEPDRWNHVAITRSFLTGDVKMYWNGEEKQTVNFGKQEWMKENSNFIVGAKPGDVAKDFQGMIDEVSVWKRVLSPTEIRQIVRQTSAFTSNHLYTVVGKLELLLDFEDTKDAPLDTSGNDYVVKRSQEAATWSTSDCQRGMSCVLLAGTEAARYPLQVPCLRLHKHWSFTAWLKTNSHNRNQNAFFFGNTFNASFGFYCHVLYEKRAVSCEGPGDFGNIETQDALVMNEGEWHHLTVTRNAASGLVALYWDGVLSQSKTLRPGNMPLGDPEYPPPSFYIGDIPGLNLHAFEGYVDEVSVWSRVLTASEVSGLMGSIAPYG